MFIDEGVVRGGRDGGCLFFVEWFCVILGPLGSEKPMEGLPTMRTTHKLPHGTCETSLPNLCRIKLMQDNVGLAEFAAHGSLTFRFRCVSGEAWPPMRLAHSVSIQLV